MRDRAAATHAFSAHSTMPMRAHPAIQKTLRECIMKARNKRECSYGKTASDRPGIQRGTGNGGERCEACENSANALVAEIDAVKYCNPEDGRLADGADSDG